MAVGGMGHQEEGKAKQLRRGLQRKLMLLGVRVMGRCGRLCGQQEWWPAMHVRSWSSAAHW
jgi:hypothetical protein